MYKFTKAIDGAPVYVTTVGILEAPAAGSAANAVITTFGGRVIAVTETVEEVLEQVSAAKRS